MKNFVVIFFSVVNLIGVSAQSSINWNMGMNISTNTYSNLHPRISLDASGNPLVVWGRMSDESIFFSRWNGTTFTTPVKLNESLTIVSTTWMGADIASHGDTLYVVMKQTPESDTASHIYMVHSYNGGVNFSSPTRVDFIGDSISRFPTVTTDATGNPIVAFMKFNNSFGESRWVVTKSSDFGNTFSLDVNASGWESSEEVCDCCPGAIVSEGNKSAILYRDNNNNIRDNFMGVSTNNAASFTNGCNIDNNNWMLMSCPSSGPDGIIIGDTVYSVFMNGGSGNYRNYLSKSSLSSVTVNSVTNLTGTIAGLSQQNYPRIASNGNAVAVVWKQNVNGSSQLPLLFTNDIANGFPASYDTVDLADITNADVAIANGKIIVIWEDDNAQTVKYRSGTFSPNITGLQEFNFQNSFTMAPNPSSNFVNIQFKNESGKLTVTNLLGQQILSQQIFNKVQLNTSEWKNGIYFITVQSGNSISTQRLIKD